MSRAANISRSAYNTVFSGWRLYLVTPLIVICSTAYLCLEVGGTNISVGDALGFLSLGIRPIPKFDPHSVFEVPLLWLLLYAYIFFSTTILLRPKSSTFTNAALFHLRKRSSYWISTYIATIGHTLVHFMLIMASAFAATLMVGGISSFQPTPHFFSVVYRLLI